MKTCTEQNIEVEREEMWRKEEWCQIEALGSVMAKMKTGFSLGEERKTDLELERKWENWKKKNEEG